MKQFISVCLLTLPLSIFCQHDKLQGQLWCFEKDFHQSLQVGDTIVADNFYIDNSPIYFKKNGRFKRIKAPVQLCGLVKAQKLDNIRGKWELNKNNLSMIIHKKQVSFSLLKLEENRLIIIVEEIE